MMMDRLPRNWLLKSVKIQRLTHRWNISSKFRQLAKTSAPVVRRKFLQAVVLHSSTNATDEYQRMILSQNSAGPFALAHQPAIHYGSVKSPELASACHSVDEASDRFPALTSQHRTVKYCAILLRQLLLSHPSANSSSFIAKMNGNQITETNRNVILVLVRVSASEINGASSFSASHKLQDLNNGCSFVKASPAVYFSLQR
jgi:hypothetical protein